MRWLYRAVAVVCALALLLTGWSLLAGWRTERALGDWHPPATRTAASAARAGELIIQPGAKGPSASHLFPREWQIVPTRGMVSSWAALAGAFAVVAVRQTRRSAGPSGP